MAGPVAIAFLLVAMSACSVQVPASGESLQGLLQVIPFLIGSLFVFLSAGGSLRIRRVVAVPQISSRAGRLLLVPFGLACYLYYLPNVDSEPEPGEKTRSPTNGRSASGPDPSPAAASPLVGRVTIRSHEVDRFAEYRSGYRIYVDRNGDSFVTGLDGDGRFSFDTIPTGSPLRVSWRATTASEYVLWPAEENLPTGWSRDSPELSFGFLRVHDLVDLRKRELVRAIEDGEFRSADGVLTRLATVLGSLAERDDAASEGLALQARQWVHDIHRDAANAGARFRKSASVDDDSIRFERRWRRKTIAQANTAEEAVLAMNTWAYYSKEVYRVDKSDWPDRQLAPDLLMKDSYYGLMRRDLQLIKEELGAWQEEIEHAVSPPELIGCLNEAGLVLALQSFESLVSSDVERVNLNHFMNLINGLQRLVRDRWTLGAWVNYPGEGYASEIERNQEREFVLRQWDREGTTDSETALTFAPGDSGRCRFEATDLPNYVFAVLENGRKLRVQYPDGGSDTFPRRQ